MNTITRSCFLGGLYIFVHSLPVLAQSVLAEPKVTEEQRDKAEVLLADYTANRSSFERFATAVRVDQTRVYRKTPEKSFTGVHWHVVCADQSKDMKRYDSILRATSPSLLTASTPTRTLFTEGGRISLRLGEHLTQELDLDRMSIEDQETARLNAPMVRFDPWNLPFTASSSLHANSFLNRETRYEERLNRESLVKFSEDILDTDMHFMLSKEHEVYLALRFRKIDDEKLPVQSALYRKNQDGELEEMGSVETVWGNRPKGGWVPLSINVSSAQGNPSKPAVFGDCELEFFWVVDTDFPAEVFDRSALYRASDLQEHIIEFAAPIARQVSDR